MNRLFERLFPLCLTLLFLSNSSAEEADYLAVEKEDSTVHIDGGLGARMNHFGFLETENFIRFPDRDLIIRNIGDEGNTPEFRQNAGRDRKGKVALHGSGKLVKVEFRLEPAAIAFDHTKKFEIELSAESPIGEASIRENAIAWHPEMKKYYLVADVVPLTNPHHPNTYETEIHLWSSRDLIEWAYHGVAVKKGKLDQSYDAHGVASPAGMAYQNGKLYVPFSARRSSNFAGRGIGLAWSDKNPEKTPWTKTNSAISDLEGEDDDPALLAVPGDQHLHLYHRRTGPGGYRIVHAASKTPEQTTEWSQALPVMPRPDAVRAQELTGVYFVNQKTHLLVIEHLKRGGIKIAHLVSENPEGPFSSADPKGRYLTAASQPKKLAYGGHITPLVRTGKCIAFFWTVPQKGKRYGLLGHPFLNRQARVASKFDFDSSRSSQEIIFFTTSPPTSVRRKSRPE